jgi:hypothetical protein
MKRTANLKLATLKCPCCAHDLLIRTSREETPCFRSIWYLCSNVVCGASFNGHQTINEQISPSGMERPLMQLPMAPAMERMKAHQAMQPETNQLDLLSPMEATV